MDIKSFQLLVKTENTARRFLAKACWKNYRRFCSRCRSLQIYRIGGRRFRCKRCGYTFHDFTGRWINTVKISARDWLWIIKLFELELSARKIAAQVGLSYPTVLKAVTVIRKSIVATTPDGAALLSGEIEMDEAYFGGRRKGKRGRGAHNKVPVFGILERKGVVKVEVVNNVTADTLLNLAVKTVRRGSIVYTDKFKSYDSLMFCGYRHIKIDHKKLFASGKVYINGVEGFWSFAKERIIKFHGISQEKFPLYLKEMEFRYNNRHNSIFNLMTKNLCCFVSDLL
jgi:transposase